MTEKEKMICGLLYDADGDKTLTADRIKAKELCYDFNMTRPGQQERQRELIRQLFEKTDGPFQVVAPFWCDYGYNITVGRNFFANHNTVILDCGKVKFGDYVLIGPNCGFYTACHPITPEERNLGLEFTRPITVGDNVWFGGGVQVMPGVTIGSNVVIGGGSVVVKDIPDNCVAAGNPCCVIRAITEADRITYFCQLEKDAGV